MESYSALFAKMDQITAERSKQIAKGFFRQEYEKTNWPKLTRDSEVVQEQKVIYEEQLKELEAAKIIQLQETVGGFSIKGVRPGGSSLKIGQRLYEVYVLSPSQERAYSRLEKALRCGNGRAGMPGAGPSGRRVSRARWARPTRPSRQPNAPVSDRALE